MVDPFAWAEKLYSCPEGTRRKSLSAPKGPGLTTLLLRSLVMSSPAGQHGIPPMAQLLCAVWHREYANSLMCRTSQSCSRHNFARIGLRLLRSSLNWSTRHGDASATCAALQHLFGLPLRAIEAHVCIETGRLASRLCSPVSTRGSRQVPQYTQNVAGQPHNCRTCAYK